LQPERRREAAQSQGVFFSDNRPMLNVLAICIGASVGALARWRLGLWLSPGGIIPWGTLVANLIGGYLVGLCVAAFHAMPQLDPVWRLALVTGFLGALTTFSSFSAEVVQMLLAQRYLAAVGTTALHLAGSLGLTVLGMQTASFFIASRG
jgi:fluoride exporter